MNSAKLQDTQSIHRSQLCFYTLKMKYLNKKIIPFTIPSEIIKYSGRNSSKEVKVLHNKNYKTLKKEIEQDTNRWKNILCSWIGRINIVKMSIIQLKGSYIIYRFNSILIKIPVEFNSIPIKIPIIHHLQI